MISIQVRVIPVAPMLKSVHAKRRLGEGGLRGVGGDMAASSPWPWELPGHNWTHIHAPDTAVTATDNSQRGYSSTAGAVYDNDLGFGDY